MANYCILRTAKLTTMGNVAGSACHTFRAIPTHNADPARTHLNVHHGAQNKDEVLDSLKKRLGCVDTVRKNAVLSLEYFIGASPEFFKDASLEKRENYFSFAKKWLEKKHGVENVIYCGIQYDESTPHMVAYVVPIDSRGKLNASAFVDGRKMLSDMQTDFAEKVGKPFNLERGMEGSKADHVPIAQFYSAINSEIPKVKTKVYPVPKPTFSQKMAEKIGLETEHSLALDAALNARLKREKEKQERQEALETRARVAIFAERARDKKAEKLSILRETANELRGIPLEDVLKRLDSKQHTADKKNWQTASGRITVTGTKFFNHDLNRGGGGAIDLVMHLEQLSYNDAVSWLGGTASKAALMGSVVQNATERAEIILNSPKKELEPPASDPSKWPRVLAYLVKARSIKEAIVQELHERGLIYADRLANVIFLSADKQSCQMRGTGEKPFHGIRGKQKEWVLSSSESAKHNKFVLVESAIDALSYTEIHGMHAYDRIISTGGSSTEFLREIATYARENAVQVVAAFDRDSEGSRMAGIVKETGVQYERQEPLNKDWNEDLQEMKNTDSTKQEQKSKNNKNNLGIR